ncbi:MAG: hypothetical protein K2O95_06075, partial [Clostridia bacterium]|nr:hypothetical protein [Clostridia bacterium]
YKWNVVYLSNTKSDGTGDPIVTLWLANSNQLPNGYKYAQWNYHADNLSAGSYPSNMYSSSMIRTLTLNNAGTWYQTNSGDVPHVVVPSENNPFAIFTMRKDTSSDVLKGSLYDFIEAPNNIYWQGTLSEKTVGTKPHNCSNDAYIADPTSAGFINASFNYYDKTGYTDWKDDKIWLPALAEMGMLEETLGLWETDAFQCSNAGGSASPTDYTWLRTAFSGYYYASFYVSPNGEVIDSHYTNTERAVRPALHLNLAKAEEYALRLLSEPQDFTKTYTGQPLTPDEETWYTETLQKAIKAGDITEIYYKDNVALSSAPTNASTYEIEYEIINTNYKWSDESVGKKRITFTIDKKAMAYPSITGAKSKPYSGGNDVRFQLDGFDPNAIDLSWKDSYTGVSINSTSPPYSVSAQTVGKYELVATIKPDQAINYKFSSTPKIEVEVTPAQLVIEKIVA